MGINDFLNMNRALEVIKSRVSLGNQRLEEVQERLSDAEQQIRKQNRRIGELEKTILKEFQRRDQWEKRAAEIQYLAQGRPIWSIKCPAPDSELRYHGGKYGDYAYCLTIRRQLELMGYYAYVDCYEDWDCPVEADVVLVIRGVHEYHPDRRSTKTCYVLWMVSHPELITCEELERYDLVLVDSKSYAEKLQQQVSVPVRPFYVLTDTEMFYPSEKNNLTPKYNRVFIGNTRGVLRNCVRWCNDNQIEVDVWGAEWEKFYPDSMYVHLHGQIEYHQISEVYRNSRFVINDHYPEMIETEMMNNRFPEVLLSGIPMVCDWTESFERNYGDMVLFYRNEEEFVQCMKEMEERYDELRANVMKNQDKLKEEFDFHRGVERMKALIDDISQ